MVLPIPFNHLLHHIIACCSSWQRLTALLAGAKLDKYSIHLSKKNSTESSGFTEMFWKLVNERPELVGEPVLLETLGALERQGSQTGIDAQKEQQKKTAEVQEYMKDWLKPEEFASGLLKLLDMTKANESQDKGPQVDAKEMGEAANRLGFLKHWRELICMLPTSHTGSPDFQLLLKLQKQCSRIQESLYSNGGCVEGADEVQLYVMACSGIMTTSKTLNPKHRSLILDLMWLSAQLIVVYAKVCVLPS